MRFNYASEQCGIIKVMGFAFRSVENIIKLYFFFRVFDNEALFCLENVYKHMSSIDLFSLGGLFSHFRPRDIP